MTLTIVFASYNKNKVKEVQKMLQMDEIKFLSLADFDKQHIPEAVEDGLSFKENALIKARYYYNILKQPVISDDSGLVVPALKYEPGVYSARYAGMNASDLENNEFLLRKLEIFPKQKRKAYFQAVVVYKDAEREEIFTGKCDGEITREPKGNSGFGYDPLFYIPSLGKTFAQLSIEEKGKISHRGMAVRGLKEFLKKNLP